MGRGMRARQEILLNSVERYTGDQVCYGLALEKREKLGEETKTGLGHVSRILVFCWFVCLSYYHGS